MQSKRISLSALGIDGVPGMENGNHLRIGFDPRMGFPPCGFLYTGVHIDWTRLVIWISRVCSAKDKCAVSAWLFAGWRCRFPPSSASDHSNAEPGLDFRNQIVGISFRASPFMPDSDPKVCEVRLTVRWDEGVDHCTGF